MKTPKATKEKIVELAVKAWEKAGHSEPIPTHYLFAVRGYWPVSMGPTNGNDVGIYDDAIFFITPDSFVGIVGNTDPSRYGWNAGAGKPMAVLEPGFWPFYRGAHRGRMPALRQYTEEEAKAAKLSTNGNFVVVRTYAKNDPRNYKNIGYFAINIHSGGEHNTSSEGCQTIPASLFQDFMQNVWDETRQARVNTVWYGLIEGPI